MLDKRLKLGGLQVGGPRTMQNPVRFRVANNVYQNRDGYLLPRFHCESELAPAPADQLEFIFVSQYRNLPFSAAKYAVDGGMKYFYDGAEIIDTGYFGPSPIDFYPQGMSQPFGIQAVEKLNCLFVHFPSYGLFKYDGTHFHRAGVPLPKFSSAQYNSAGAAYVRILQHKIDFQGNIINSGYVQFRATPDGGNNINIRHDLGATDIIGNAEVTPTRRTSVFNGSYDEVFFIGSGAGVVNAGAQQVVIPTASGNNFGLFGSYIMISASKLSSATTGLGVESYGFAMRVKATTSTSITLDLTNVKYVNSAGTWQTTTMSTATTYFASARKGSNYWMSVWTSNTSTGNYVYKGVWPCLYNAVSSQIDAFSAASLTTPSSTYIDTCFNFGGNLGDFYDVTSVKDIFPSIASVGGSITSIEGLPFSFSTYSDLALSSNSNEVFFSDTTAGGAFEMTNALAFIVVGEGDDGYIQGVCGNSDFLIISRRYRNYYVTGNLPTANYRAQAVTRTEMGAYSNESMISVEDKILLMNKQGIWAFYAGGRCDEVSSFVRGFFDDWSNSYDFPEQNYWDISSLPDFIYITNEWVPASPANQWLRARNDISRGLVYFLNPNEQVLVLNMNNGEFYTWSGLSDNLGLTTPKVKDITPINGVYHAAINGAAFDAGIYSELKTGASKYGYGSLRLETTWFTAGEPSLEKKLLQLKMWGPITASVDVSHFLDWKTDEVDDGTYTPATTDFYSHKKRLASENFLAASVAMEVSPAELVFQLEGLEIEWSPFQGGMKK